MNVQERMSQSAKGPNGTLTLSRMDCDLSSTFWHRFLPFIQIESSAHPVRSGA